jgi:hypothetical protein
MPMAGAKRRCFVWVDWCSGWREAKKNHEGINTWWINTRDAVKRQGFGEKRMSKMFILFACIIIIFLNFVEIFILRLYKPLLTLLIFC